MRDEATAVARTDRNVAIDIAAGGLIDNITKVDEQLRGMADTIGELRRRLMPILRQDAENATPPEPASLKPASRTQLIGHVQDIQSVAAARHNELSAIIDAIDL